MNAPQPTIACDGQAMDRDILSANVSRAAAGLVALGVAPGDRVILIARNSLEFVEITLAAGAVGAFAVPVNWHFTQPEVDYLLEDSAPAAIFVQDDLRGSVGRAWTDTLPVIVVGGRGEDLDYQRWRDGNAPYAGPPRTAPGSIVYTSGTTGRPKGVRRAPPTPDQQIRMRAVRAELYRIDADSRVLVPGPMYHAFPNQLAINAALGAQHTEIMSRFDPETMLATIERERITTVGLAPIMFVRLLRLPPEVRARYDLSSLRWAIHAGGACAGDVKRQMIDWWGPVVAEYYGGTETGPLTLSTSQDWLDRPGTCGKPLADAELRIVDAQGRDVEQGASGEIFGRLRAYPDFTYHNDPGKREQVGLGDLVSLGDVGYQDADGYLYLCDRARDMVVSGGVNIYPAEVEGALFALPGVEDCAVFGVPDAEYGEAVVAFVCGAAELDGEALRLALRQSVAGYKVPKRIVQVGSLGRDPSGKVRKRDLRDRFLASPPDRPA